MYLQASDKYGATDGYEIQTSQTSCQGSLWSVQVSSTL